MPGQGSWTSRGGKYQGVRGTRSDCGSPSGTAVRRQVNAVPDPAADSVSGEAPESGGELTFTSREAVYLQSCLGSVPSPGWARCR